MILDADDENLPTARRAWSICSILERWLRSSRCEADRALNRPRSSHSVIVSFVAIGSVDLLLARDVVENEVPRLKTEVTRLLTELSGLGMPQSQ